MNCLAKRDGGRKVTVIPAKAGIQSINHIESGILLKKRIYYQKIGSIYYDFCLIGIRLCQLLIVSGIDEKGVLWKNKPVNTAAVNS